MWRTLSPIWQQTWADSICSHMLHIFSKQADKHQNNQLQTHWNNYGCIPGWLQRSFSSPHALPLGEVSSLRYQVTQHLLYWQINPEFILLVLVTSVSTAANSFCPRTYSNCFWFTVCITLFIFSTSICTQFAFCLTTVCDSSACRAAPGCVITLFLIELSNCFYEVAGLLDDNLDSSNLKNTAVLYKSSDIVSNPETSFPLMTATWQCTFTRGAVHRRVETVTRRDWLCSSFKDTVACVCGFKWTPQSPFPFFSFST